MAQKKAWQLIVLPLVLLMTALLMWACSGQQQEATVNSSTAATTVVATTVTTETIPAATEAITAETTTATSGESAADAQRFTIDQSQSAARFTLDEELMGAPKTVVGTTNLVEGAITIDLADFSKTTISPIQIDARGFATDSSRRDGAIQRFVLGSNSEENRYIVFTPTTITGFPATAAIGDTFELQIVGDLTISGVTKAVTFVTNVTVTGESEISGLASAQILRSDFNLNIPSVPSVANVTDEVLLELQFVAKA